MQIGSINKRTTKKNSTTWFFPSTRDSRFVN